VRHKRPRWYRVRYWTRLAIGLHSTVLALVAAFRDGLSQGVAWIAVAMVASLRLDLIRVERWSSPIPEPEEE